MSQQAKTLEALQVLITEILKTGTASIEQGQQLDKLEANLLKERSFKASSNDTYDNQGEEIAYMFFKDAYEKGINKLYEYKITPEDFFGFVNYHFDEDEDDELEIMQTFNDTFKQKIQEDYTLKCKSK